MNIFVSLLVLIVFAGLVIMQRDILFHTELENDIKRSVVSHVLETGNREMQFKDIQSINTLWDYLESSFTSRFDDENPPQSSWNIKSLNDTSKMINVPMTFQPIQSINVITALYLGRSLWDPVISNGLHGAMISDRWVPRTDGIPHTQYTLFAPENSKLEDDKELDGMIEKAMKTTSSQFFFLNSIPKNKTLSVLKELRQRKWIDEDHTETIFFKLNVFNPNLRRLAQVMIIWDRIYTGHFNSYVLTSTAPDVGFYPPYEAADVEDLLRWFFEFACILTVIVYLSHSVYRVASRKVRIVKLLISLEFLSICCIIYHFFVWYSILSASDDYRKRLANSYDQAEIAPDQSTSCKAILKSLYEGCVQNTMCPGAVFGVLNGTAPYRFLFIRSVILSLLLLALVVFFRIPRTSGFALLPNILRKSIREIGLVGMVLVLLFSVYAVVGSMLFGHTMTNFSTLAQSFKTNVEMALGGDVGMDSVNTEFVDIPIAGEGSSFIPIKLLPVLYKWSLQILVTFILINIFVAVVTSAYTRVKDDMRNANSGMMNERILEAKDSNVLEELYGFIQSFGIRKRWNPNRNINAATNAFWTRWYEEEDDQRQEGADLNIQKIRVPPR